MKKYNLRTTEPSISKERIEKHKDFASLLDTSQAIKSQTRKVKRMRVIGGTALAIILLGLSSYFILKQDAAGPKESQAPSFTSLQENKRIEPAEPEQEVAIKEAEAEESEKEETTKKPEIDPLNQKKRKDAPTANKPEQVNKRQNQTSKEPSAVKEAEEEISYLEATPKGGMKQLYMYFNQALVYPEAAIANEVEGTVILTFSISKEGTAREIQVLQGVSDDIDAEAIRLIQHMPEWEPARLNGAAVSSRVNLPITFKITEPHE